MPKSDTPANNPKQGPADWTKEPRSDDLLLRGLLKLLSERRLVEP
jgi:hypothetical protein